MTVKDSISRASDAWSAFWKARNRRERSMLMTATAVVVFAILYVSLIDPAVTGTASLGRSLPLLRQQAAQMRQLAAQVAKQPQMSAAQQAEGDEAAPPLELTREAINTSLKHAGLNASTIDISERGVRLQFAAVAPAALIGWLEQAQAQRFTVNDAQIDMPSSETAKADVALAKTEEERQ